MTLNERESFLAFHYEQYLKENPNIDLVNAKYIYEYAHKNPLVEHLRESHFIVWQAAKAQAVPETHLLIPKEPNRKTIMAMACVCLGAVGSGPEFLTLKEAKDVYSALVEKESGAEQ
ncbi:hypothetical protein OHV47_14635 [Acinetobacter baumannii]|nr:hypothetical protein [Acinetobacter baumannii]